MPYRDKEKQREAQRRYQASDKGRANQKRYYTSEKGKATLKAYRQTDKGKQVKCLVENRRYWRNPEYYRLKALANLHGTEPALLSQVRERDKVCRRCSASDNLTFDHIVPVSKGGKATLENLQILCVSCNTSKGNR